MRRIFVLICAFQIFSVCRSLTTCESTRNDNWSSYNNILTCFLKDETTISEPTVTVTSTQGNSILGMKFRSNKKISFLPINVKENFPNLIGLDGAECSIDSITYQNFQGLKKLKLLFLFSNQIESFSSDAFEDLISLEELDLGFNLISALEPGSFQYMTQLKILFLHNNQINGIGPDSFTNLFSLEHLTLYNNKIDNVATDTFKDLNSLKKLDLGFNQIKTIQPGAFQNRPKLKTLYLHNNQIEFIGSNSFKNLISLEDLTLYHNKIETIANDNFGSLTSLISLDMGFNRIKAVSDKTLQNMKRLQILKLHENQIEIIGDETFVDLNALQELYLGQNKIKFMTGQALQPLKNLKRAQLTSNVCIDEEFLGRTAIASMPQVVTDKCGVKRATIQKPAGSKNILNLSCGKVSFSIGFVVGGTETIRGQWPFLVALFNLETSKFFCGGSLITTKHVLTAAHCIREKRQVRERHPEEISLLIGRHDIGVASEGGAAVRDVHSIAVHPDWSSSTKKWDADIAVLFFVQPVEFSGFIQPVCLLSEEQDDTSITGTVVGWGKSEGHLRHENIPRQVTIQSVNDTYCYTHDAEIAAISTPRTFCAGGRQTGPCHGDSGGGFFVKENSVWILKGIVSASIVDEYKNCNLDRYTIYTSVPNFSEWIESEVRKDLEIF